ncbi:MAG: hypothetical protein H7246_09245 [Phycisphaerae bacterium]|nr:hypothetical protein [Saprospiraceae bacterium]
MQKQLPILFFFGFILLLFNQQAFAQGCVSVRSTGCSSQNMNSTLSKGQVEFTSNFRYFNSFRHFVGDVEQHERIEEKSNVIIKSYTYDFGLNYGLSSRSFIGFSIPFVVNDRSSVHYTDDNDVQQRYSVQGRGLSDIRATGYYWVLDPNKRKKVSLLAGLGVKLPTGNPSQFDLFHAKSSKGKDSTYIRTVDQAVQPGDGGFGISLESQLNYRIVSGLSFYASGYYLFSPQETSNHLRTVPLTADTIQRYLSITDQYLARAGFSYALPTKTPIMVGLGSRLEGVPVHDAVGGSNGRRRPGYTITVEPTLAFSINNTRLSISVPYSIYRKRTRSVYDLSRGNNADGTPVNGDAAFADYSINVSFVYLLGGNKSDHSMEAPSK